MGIRESALNTITALTNSDFVRMVTAAGASRKASLQSVAQHIIESYAGSTLAGRQQSVKSALDELNSTIALTPTVFKNRINILSQVCFKVGDRVYVNIICIANQAFAGNTIITGLPTPSTAQFIPVNVSGAYIQATTSPVTGIIADNIASGTKFVISGIYSAQ